jgi:hypothetical protein
MELNEFKDIRSIKRINLNKIEAGTISKNWLFLMSDFIGRPISVPVLVAKGKEPGPTLTVIALLHGNELNGLSVVQHLFDEIDPTKIKGNIIGVPVLNIPGFLRKKRRIDSNHDLNSIMPGKKNGNFAEIYAHQIIEKIIKKSDYVIDLHTARVGTRNTYYIRANMSNDSVKNMAITNNPRIILDHAPSSTTLRGVCESLNIPCICAELGDPLKFQESIIQNSTTGIINFMKSIKMIKGTIKKSNNNSIICKDSFRITLDESGIVQMLVTLGSKIKKDTKVAILKDIFGNIIKEYYSPKAGIVIGLADNPVNSIGSNIIHIGIIGKDKNVKNINNKC